ncbi:hypothetical protein I5S86_10930 [Priestia aryabhattai]|nr:hypothetical protein I5S86_10930 [Priestia aryabhattai]
MTDRELLELAAKAAGLKINQAFQAQRDAVMAPAKASLWIDDGSTAWNPLTDDGHALRLAMTLELGVVCKRESDPYEKNRSVVTDPYRVNQLRIVEAHKGNPEAATRRAIVRAAAEIGQAMQEKS